MTSIKPKALRIRQPPVSLFPFLYSGSFRRHVATCQPLAQQERPEDLHSDATVGKRQIRPNTRRQHDQKSKFDNNKQRGNDIPFDTASIVGGLGRQQLQQSTMTDMERDTFANLFDTLGHKGTQGLNPQQPKSHQRNKAIEDQSYIEGLQEEIQGWTPGSYSSLDAAESIYDVSQIYAEQLAPNLTGKLERYPIAIREMARRAEIRRTREQRQPKKVDPILLEAKHEMERVEKLLFACQTDKQVWDVMQEEVFAKVEIIEEANKREEARRKEEAKEREEARKKEEAQKKEQAARETTAAADAASISSVRPKSKSKSASPKESPSLSQQSRDPAKEKLFQILTHSYATLILLATRLLLRRNSSKSTQPSTLATALLHACKELGPTSYALAASTPLYNSLLQHTWRSTAQYSSVFALLHEMEQAGLSMDSNTLEVVEEMLGFRHAAEQGSLGEAVKAVEGQVAMRKLEGQEVRRWRDKILAEIGQKEIDRASKNAAARDIQNLDTVHRDGNMAESARAVAAAAT